MALFSEFAELLMSNLLNTKNNTSCHLLYFGNTKRTRYTNKGTPYHVIAPAPTRMDPTLIAAVLKESLLS